MGNVNMEASQINYRGGEKKMSVEDALKSTSGEAAAIAQLQTDVLNLNSNKANQITIAPFFSAEASYDPGDLVYYNGLTYRCVNAHEGDWDADDFAATTISNELDTLKSGLIKVVTLTGQGDSIVDISSLGFANPVVTVSAQFSDTYIILAQASIDNGSLKVQVKYWTGQCWDTTSATWCATITELTTIS